MQSARIAPALPARLLIFTVKTYQVAVFGEQIGIESPSLLVWHSYDEIQATEGEQTFFMICVCAGREGRYGYSQYVAYQTAALSLARRCM
jgi:hypothetical protein